MEIEIESMGLFKKWYRDNCALEVHPHLEKYKQHPSRTIMGDGFLFRFPDYGDSQAIRNIAIGVANLFWIRSIDKLPILLI